MENEHLITTEDICKHYNVEQSFIEALHNAGLVEVALVEQHPCVQMEQLPQLEKYFRMHYELHINMEGLEAITHLLMQIETLQQQQQRLKQKLQLLSNMS